MAGIMSSHSIMLPLTPFEETKAGRTENAGKPHGV